jgi:uncharacterized membrane protein YagU involved in acid resistance
MNVKNILLAGIISGIILEIVMFIGGSLIQLAFPYDIFNLGGMRAIDDPMMVGFFLAPIILGLILALIYAYTKKAYTGTQREKILTFGILMWLVYNVPSFAIMISTMTYPFGFHVDQIFGGLIYMIIASIVIVKIEK